MQLKRCIISALLEIIGQIRRRTWIFRMLCIPLCAPSPMRYIRSNWVTIPLSCFLHIIFLYYLFIKSVLVFIYRKVALETNKITTRATQSLCCWLKKGCWCPRVISRLVSNSQNEDTGLGSSWLLRRSLVDVTVVPCDSIYLTSELIGGRRNGLQAECLSGQNNL